VAGIVGGVRERTASMISLGSMACRYAEGAQVGVSELALDDADRNPLTRELDGVGVAQLMVVPTSAQPSICRHSRYANVREKVLLIAANPVPLIGITTDV
jgi:hypothetical protein